MKQETVDIQTDDGLMNSFIIRPDRPGPHPVVIFYMDSMGVRQELLDMCSRIATAGYYVLLPNLYYRKRRSVDIDANRIEDPAYADGLALMWEMNRSLSNTMIERDSRSMFAFLEGQPSARSGKLAIVGYCMSGRFVFRVAGAFSGKVAAAASVYGARLMTDLPDSAHLLANQIKGEMYFACAQHDTYAPPQTLVSLQQVLDAAKINASIEVYPEAHHGFAFPTRHLYHKAATERHWEQLFDLFERNLQL